MPARPGGTAMGVLYVAAPPDVAASPAIVPTVASCVGNAIAAAVAGDAEVIAGEAEGTGSLAGGGGVWVTPKPVSEALA